ncbi:Similar to RASSF8: Ras association domain-containing protein 8 (Homo sapiens) [Cotesia congregata]|uniref:Similar to RASSF8: Ras association domain-containing protein 8 (Homo sapiens) n=1 Tax=Cotesia congregata TaxID=51543 RepID=A0A8J2HSM5_COTCN|nr:Similar to RASSF8: Ras association domain-containing protein 8 (Homo sapiens) [Cotesia congregata]
MELKVWVEGIQRIVCGVTETTTCEDVVYALAHATSQSGRFTLILMKYGEYAPDVQLILRKSNSDVNKNQPNQVQMENIAVVQPTLQTKIQSRKATFKSNESPTRASSSEGFISLTHKKTREVPPYRDPPGPDSSPLRTLPPYRDPPPPIVTNNKSQSQESSTSENFSLSKEEQSSATGSTKSKRSQEIQDTKGLMQSSKPQLSQPQNMVAVAYTHRYAELIKLVNNQRDTLSSQQVDLTKLNAEILYWESKNREHYNQMDFISQEINRIESAGRVLEEQLSELMHTEEENEIVRQQEKSLISEINSLRSKINKCETELLQCKNKIRLQSELELAKRLTEHTNQSADLLKQEVTNIESAIVDKKLQVEKLVSEMKEANLQSLTVACQEEQIKNLLEGTQKPICPRKLIGPPRQLENAVPTSKNPHGVWV